MSTNPLSAHALATTLLALVLGFALGLGIRNIQDTQATLSSADQSTLLKRIDARMNAEQARAEAFERKPDASKLEALQYAKQQVQSARKPSALLGMLWYATLILLALVAARGAFNLMERLRASKGELRRLASDTAMLASPLTLGTLVLGALSGCLAALILPVSFQSAELAHAQLLGWGQGMHLIERLGPWLLIGSGFGALCSLLIWIAGGEARYFPAARRIARLAAWLTPAGVLLGSAFLIAHLPLAERWLQLALPPLAGTLALTLALILIARIWLKRSDTRAPKLAACARAMLAAATANTELACLGKERAASQPWLPWYVLFQRSATLAALVALTLSALRTHGVALDSRAVLMAAGLSLPMVWTLRRNVGYWHLSYATLAALMSTAATAAPAIALVSLLIAPLAIACDALISLHLAALSAGTPALEVHTLDERVPESGLRLVRGADAQLSSPHAD